MSNTINTDQPAVKPFPFLQLPPELRIEIYSVLFPRRPYITLAPPGKVRGAGPARLPRLDLSILRTSKQTHSEAIKYLYQPTPLFLKIRCDKSKDVIHGTFEKACESLHLIGTRNRETFKRLEIQLDMPFNATPVIDYEQLGDADQLVAMLSLIPNLDTVTFLFRTPVNDTSIFQGFALDMRLITSMLFYCLNRIPDSVNVQWDLKYLYRQMTYEAVKEFARSRSGSQEVDSVYWSLWEPDKWDTEKPRRTRYG